MLNFRLVTFNYLERTPRNQEELDKKKGRTGAVYQDFVVGGAAGGAGGGATGCFNNEMKAMIAAANASQKPKDR